MINKLVEDRINELRFQTRDNIKYIELAHIPYAYYLKYQNMTKYTCNGKIYDYTYEMNDTNNTMHILMAHNLPFTFQTRNYKTYICNVKDLIQTGEMIPFLLFVNGKLLRWSDITIVRDYRYCYIIINNIEYDIKEDSIICLLMPFNVRYKEGISSIEELDEKTLYFDIDGKYTHDLNKIYTSVTILEQNTDVTELSNKSFGFRFKFKYQGEDVFRYSNEELLFQLEQEGITDYLPDIISYLKVYNDDGTSYIVDVEAAQDFQIEVKDYGQLLFIENCLIFSDGLLRIDFRDFLQEKSLNFILYDRPESVIIKVFKYNKSPKSNDLIYKIPNRLATASIIDSDIDILDSIKDNYFNFSFDKNSTYKNNLNRVFEYIVNYDFNLFHDIIKSQSKIVSFKLTGEMINNHTIDNYYSVPRIIDKNTKVSYCIIFMNGKIYRYYHMCEFNSLSIKMYIPNGYIDDSDIIEIMHFKEVDNKITKFTINENNNIIDLADIDISNSTMYVDGIEDQLYSLDNKFFKTRIGFTYIKNKDKYTIDIDPKYYDKQLYLVQRNRFAHLYVNIPEDSIGVELDMNDEFLYCRNKSQYMIFVNGALISSEYFELKYPEKKSPVNNMTIYFYIPLYKNTIINIFYIPRPFTYMTYPTVNENGYISVDVNELNYPLDKDCFLYFINGKKILPENITNINKNTVKLDIDTKSTNNLTIIKHIDEISDLSSVFLNTSLWDSFLESLTDVQRDKLFNLTDIIQSNTDTDIYEEVLSKEQLVYELIAQYYVRNNIAQNKDFDYTLDDSVIDENDVDSEGVNIIRLLDSNDTNKANIYGAGIEEEVEYEYNKEE